MDPVISRWCKTKETGKLWSFETGIWRSSTAAITQNAGDSSEMNCPKGRSFGCCKDSHESTLLLLAPSSSAGANGKGIIMMAEATKTTQL